MRVLIACEKSGIVRDKFLKKGHDAMSCDLLPTDRPGPHYRGSVFDIIDACWDLMIAHPPCTHLAVSGAAWFKDKIMDGRQAQAIAFFMRLIKADIPKIAVENPICIMSRLHIKPSQIIHPWEFGHETTKATSLWLKNLPPLFPTSIVSKGERKVYASGKSSPMWHANSGGGQGHKRSVTFQGIADAMANQWG